MSKKILNHIRVQKKKTVLASISWPSRKLKNILKCEMGGLKVDPMFLCLQFLKLYILLWHTSVFEVQNT